MLQQFCSLYLFADLLTVTVLATGWNYNMELWSCLFLHLVVECFLDSWPVYWNCYFCKKERIKVEYKMWNRGIKCHVYVVVLRSISKSVYIVFFYCCLREDEDQRIHFKAMIVSSVLQGILFLQEILIVINVESGKHEWRAIFTPAYLLCLLCIFACIWSCWRHRGVEVIAFLIYNNE